MLIVSRKPNESITFPAFQTQVQFLRVQGTTIRLGVNAPPEIKVLRTELMTDADREQAETLTHKLSNRLSRISLALHLYQRQVQAGRHAEANATLHKALHTLEEMDRDWLQRQLSGDGATVPAPNAETLRAGVLLVEDDPNERELLAGLLDMNGCTCTSCPDGEAALAYLAASPIPKVVLLDMRMPRCDGPNTLRRLRENPRFDSIKVYSVSGTAPQVLGIPIGPGGLDGWFPKPLNPRRLWDELRPNLLGEPSAD